MLNIIETPRNGLCFVGDIHGEFKSIEGLMKHTDLYDTTYVFAGDCGFGFYKDDYYKYIFNKLRKTTHNYNNQCLFVAGNHDDRDYYINKKINIKYFKTIPDYTVIKTPNHNVLCVGGAISIDRSHRIPLQRENILKYQLEIDDDTILVRLQLKDESQRTVTFELVKKDLIDYLTGNNLKVYNIVLADEMPKISESGKFIQIYQK